MKAHVAAAKEGAHFVSTFRRLAASMMTTEMDSLARARQRIGFVFEGFYDDEPSEPDQAIRDLLTDVLHECAARDIDFDDALARAFGMYQQERDEWAERARVAELDAAMERMHNGGPAATKAEIEEWEETRA